MVYYRTRYVVLTFFFLLLQPPFPTPTPTLADSEASKIINDAANAALSVVVQAGVLGVVALALLFGILWIIFIGRKRPADNAPLNNLVIQLGKNTETNEKLTAKLTDLYAERETRVEQDIEAIAIAQRQAKEQSVKSDVIIERLMNSYERMTGIFEILTTKGSQPVQDMRESQAKMITEGIRPDAPTREQLERIEQTVKETLERQARYEEECKPNLEQEKEEWRTLLAQAQQTIEQYKGYLETLQNKRKTDSQPIAKVTPDDEAKDNAA